MSGRWSDAVALVAVTFHTQPSEFDAMELDDLLVWYERAKSVSKNHGR